MQQEEQTEGFHLLRRSLPWLGQDSLAEYPVDPKSMAKARKRQATDGAAQLVGKSFRYEDWHSYTQEPLLTIQISVTEMPGGVLRLAVHIEEFGRSGGGGNPTATRDRVLAATVVGELADDRFLRCEPPYPVDLRDGMLTVDVVHGTMVPWDARRYDTWPPRQPF